MPNKKKPAKTPNKPKKPEKPNKPKSKKKTPTRTYRSLNTAARNIKNKLLTKAAKNIQEQVKRNDKRQAAIETAAAFLRGIGYSFDQGNHLLIVNRVKLIMAFDIPEPLRNGLQENADVTKHRLVYVETAKFKPADLREVVMNAVNLQREKEVPPKKLRRSKKLQKSVDKNLGLT